MKNKIDKIHEIINQLYKIYNELNVVLENNLEPNEIYNNIFMFYKIRKAIEELECFIKSEKQSLRNL